MVLGNDYRIAVEGSGIVAIYKKEGRDFFLQVKTRYSRKSWSKLTEEEVDSIASKLLDESEARRDA